ncbi:ABC transporter permease [Halogeometricum borinquense]|uniref:ABC transporter permease n=1 Tax=Halogeometricum borinquense TaxID=60847 RepID=UPI00341219DF
MGYRRVLSFGWARRDTLAVVVIALTVSFLVGAAVLGVALGDQTTTIAAEYETSYGIYETPQDGSSSTALALTLAETTLDGQRVPVVGIPRDASALTVRGETISLPTPERGTLAAAAYQGPESRLQSDASGETVSIRSRQSNSFIPDSWYVTDPATAASFDHTTQVTIRSVDGRAATPLLSALEFFVRGAGELVRLLRLATVAAGILVAVTIYSVVQITVRERRPDIAVLRSTGATPRQVLQLFALRAVTLTAVGTAAGYGFGLILVRVVVNAAIYGGLPTSLSAQISQPVLSVLVPAVVLFLVVGGLSGLLAAYKGATQEPAALAKPARQTTDADTSRFAGLLKTCTGFLKTRLLGWEALVPTASTLTVFMCALLLLTAVAGAVGPVSDTDGQTITQPDAPHPIASNVPVVYADALRSQGAAASPEILLFEVYEGDPIVARGVNFSAYRELSGVQITEGSAPNQRYEAIIGADLARSSDLSPGQTVVIGGSTTASVARFNITGTFTGTGIQDDQLLVSIPAAREMGNIRDDSVHFVRTRGLDREAAATSTLVATSARLQNVNNRTGVSVAVTNLGLSEATREFDIKLGSTVRKRSVTVGSQQSTRVFVPFDEIPSGTHTLAVGEITKNVSVGGPSGASDSLSGLSISAPRTAPTNSTPAVRVSLGDTPVANATISLGAQTVTTNDRGLARLALNSTGNATLVATRNGERATTTVTVRDDAVRALTLDATVSPDAPSIFTRPKATVRAWNPWVEPIESSLRVTGPSVEKKRPVTVESGETATVRARLPRRPAGSYTVAVTTTAGQRVTTTYTVQGDDRLGAALAQSGRYTGGGGITQAIQVAFGNIEVLVLAVVALLSVMTVGSTTAAFTRAVHTAKREIGIRRATGASPWAILSDVIVDTLKIGTTATVLAGAIAFGVVSGLLSVGELRVFGVVLEPVITPTAVVAALVGGVALAVISATLATAGMVRKMPASLLVDRHIPVPEGSGERRDA